MLAPEIVYRLVNELSDKAAKQKLQQSTVCPRPHPKHFALRHLQETTRRDETAMFSGNKQFRQCTKRN
jgi:hypothetical protein